MFSRIHIIGSVGIIGSALAVSFFTLNPYVHGLYTKLAPVTYQTKQTDSKLPARLIIPSIGINAGIESVGITPDGAMDTPKGPDTVAWYGLGPRPGEIGSAVIDGHSGWKDNVPAVFDNLYLLRAGDKIYIRNTQGITTTFVVREIKKYNPATSAASVFRSSDGKAHLNLITCEGVWNPMLKNYSERLILFADKVV